MPVSDKNALLLKPLNKDKKKKTASTDELTSSFDEHQLDCHELSERFALSNINVADPKLSGGLSAKEAKRCLTRGRRISTTPWARMSHWLLFLRQFLNIVWIALIGAVLLNASVAFIEPESSLKLYVAIFILAIVIIMSLVSFFIEKSARKHFNERIEYSDNRIFPVVRRCYSAIRTWCSVLRDGKECTIPTEQLVVGDLLFIRPGVHVVADVRLLSCNGLKLDDCCVITERTESIELTEEVAACDVTALDACNIAFRGSFCVDGDGLGVVIRVPGNTLVDHLASQTAEDKRKVSLKDEVVRPFRFMVVAAVGIATVMFLWDAYMLSFKNVIGIFTNGFTVLVVACIPQGLPTAILCQHTIAARRLARKNVQLKNVDVMEALGAATVVVADMAGALTENCFVVARLWCNKQYFSGLRSLQQLQMTVEQLESPLREVLAVMTVCNRMSATLTTNDAAQCDNNSHDTCILPTTTLRDAEMGGSRDPSPTPSECPTSEAPWRSGSVCRDNPTDLALLQYACQFVDANDMRSRYEIVFELPFDPARRWHLVIARLADKASPDGLAMFTLMITGHPKSLIKWCSTIASESGPQILDENRRRDLQHIYQQIRDEGHRVIGFVSTTFEAPDDIRFSADTANYPQDEYCFLGMASIMGEPQDGTIEAIQECREAGIKVFMMTLDGASTAEAVARRTGLMGRKKASAQYKDQDDLHDIFVIDENEMNSAVVDSDSLTALTTEQWDNLLQKQTVVFARATFEHKLLIVKECQRRREIVAVTGATCSDVPALRRADIGFAVSSSDSELAKQAADVIVKDGRLSSIVASIEESRLMYDHLKKTTAFTLTHLWPEIFAVAINLTLGLPRSLTLLQILSIDLGCDLLPAIALAWETGERDLMKKPPRKRDAHLVSWSVLFYSYVLAGTIIAAGCLVAYLSVFWHYNITPSHLAFSWTASAKNFGIGLISSAYDQERVVAEAAAAWYITLTLSQVLHLWMCTTRRVSIFRHGIKNIVGLFGCAASVLFIYFMLFTPGLQAVVGVSPPPLYVWTFCLAVGVILLLFSESRKCLIRRWPRNKIVQFLEW